MERNRRERAGADEALARLGRHNRELKEVNEKLSALSSTTDSPKLKSYMAELVAGMTELNANLDAYRARWREEPVHPTDRNKLVRFVWVYWPRWPLGWWPRRRAVLAEGERPAGLERE